VFLKKALDEAIDWKCWEILETLLNEARYAGLNHWRGSVMRLIHRVAEPDWIDVKPSVLRD
jgi:hypothetical protein